MPEENANPEAAVRPDLPNFLTKTKFEDLGLAPEILAGLDEARFIYCTPIQAQVLPVSLTGKDVAGQAQTGTGKTGAFLVTIFARLLARTGRPDKAPAALIIAPTRELALQVYEDAATLGRYTGLNLVQAIGGLEYQEQTEAFNRKPDIVVGTPGRIIDYIKQGVFKTSGIEILVIDEADRLFDLGFVKDLRYILKKLPHYEKRQSMLFSATLSYRVLELTYDYMNLPEFISATPEKITVEQVEQSLLHVGREEKLPVLLGLLDREDWTRVLIFVNTKAGVEWVAKKLKGNGLPAEGITGDLPQPRRLRLMERFKDGRLKILVATDVASRGIHVEDISHVINYDLPQDIENYVHRIGRTARAGKSGRAISLACEEYVFHLEPLQEMLGYQIPVVWYDDSWIKEDKAGPVRIDRPFRPERSARPGRPDRERPDRERADRGRPDRQRPRGPEDIPPRRVPKKPRTIARPGGIFGLAPGSRPLPVPIEPLPVPIETAPPPPESPKTSESPIGLESTKTPDVEKLEDVRAAEGPKKKKRRRRRRKKTPQENAGSNNHEKADDDQFDLAPDLLEAAENDQDDSDDEIPF